MGVLNKLIVALMPLTPRPLIAQVARRYIAGETLDSGIQKVAELNDEGFLVTMDILGESITSREETEQSLELYRELIRELKRHPELQTGLSVKLTQLGLKIDQGFCRENLQQLIFMGREMDLFIRLDMEDSSVTSATLDLFERSLDQYDRMGVAIQSYLHRSEQDMERLTALGANVRMCKGIYNEPAPIAYQDREAIRQNFITLGKRHLDQGGYLAIATHDQFIIDHFRTYIDNKNIPTSQYEFQALLGVPIGETLHLLVREGRTVRIYTPFGKDWYAYSSRRLKENPDIAGYVVKDFFK